MTRRLALPLVAALALASVLAVTWLLYRLESDSDADRSLLVIVPLLAVLALVALALFRALGERESLLEETGRLAKVGGWQFDPATGKGSWTSEIALIHDLDPRLKPSRDFGLTFYAPGSRERIEAAVQRSLQDGTPYDLELELVSARGTRKWVRTISRPVLKDGRVIRMRGALQDITDRKHTELRLEAQLQRLQMLERITRAIGERQDLASILQVVIATLEDQLPLDFGCICLYDPVENRLTTAALGTASEPLAAALSLGPGEVLHVDENGLSRSVKGHLVYEPDVATVAASLPRRLAAAGLRAFVAAPLQVEGMVFGVLLAARRTAESFSSSDCEFLRQLTEHVALAAHHVQLLGALQAANEDLHQTQHAVMQQDRLRVLGQMASGIAHDINNAISPIMLYTDSLLETEPGLSERARQSLLTIQRAVSDVAETVARMREFYRQREPPGALQPVRLEPLVVQLRDLTRARWESIPQRQGIVIDLKLDLGPALPPVRGVESEIREALINLVFNATDAMPQGGVLTIRARRGGADTAWIEVSDSGTGMDAETRTRCLEPFFTTKGERGTGLGLAMVYGVMQRHHGKLDIDSEPGRGTTVRLTFAVADEEPAAVAAPTVLPPPGSILLVDDDPLLLRSLCETLELDGHRIQTAGGGEQGIAAFRAALAPGGAPFDVVITDLGMPHVDGRAVASAVKQLAPATHVILLTGWGERLRAEGHRVPGVDRVLGKPPRLRELREVLVELTARDH